MTTLDWIQSIEPDFQNESWQNDRVLASPLIENVDFYDCKGKQEKYIDPSKIIGIDYWGNYNHSVVGGFNENYCWTDLLNGLKRGDELITNFKTKEEVLTHINNEEIETKIVAQYGDELITRGGQHRLCVAKFLNVKSVKVYLTVYELNFDKLNKFKKLEISFEYLKSKSILSQDEELHRHYVDPNYSVFITLNDSFVGIPVDLLSEFIEYYKTVNTSNLLYPLRSFKFRYGCKPDSNTKYESIKSFIILKPLIYFHKRELLKVSENV